MTKEIIDPRDPNSPYEAKVAFSNQIRRNIILQDLQYLIEHNNRELSVERLIGMYIASISDEGQRQQNIIDMVYVCDQASDSILKTGMLHAFKLSDKGKILTMNMLETRKLAYKNDIDYRIKCVHYPETYIEQDEDRDFAYWVGYVFLHRPEWWTEDKEKYEKIRFDAIDIVATAAQNSGIDLKDLQIKE